MPYAPGTRFGSHEILGFLGAGGMGEVYRARDTRLGRDVALKFLPDDLARSPARRARFEREARLLAAVNHPGIAALYDVRDRDGVPVLVLELVEGVTLEERLVHGPMPLREALDTCRQVAEAMEAAHEKGIVHRDLKPSNVKLTRDGRVKVLDFGLAKLTDEDGLEADARTTAHTREGAVVGTLAYMSPEQARSQRVDRRTDVWSFGGVAFELLSGQKAFAAPTAADTIVRILEAEPDWSALPAGTPGPVRSLLRRCLQKDLSRRLHDIADARLEVEEALGALDGSEPAEREAEGAATRARGPRPVPRAVLWFLAGAFIAGAMAWLLIPRTSPAPWSAKRLQVLLPPDAPLSDPESVRPALALSPDGTRLVYVAARAGGTQLFARTMDQLQAAPIAGTDGASSPFFSPDGAWVGFAAEGKLKKVPIGGGQPTTLCDAPRLRGASWAAADTIVFSPSFHGGLYRVSSRGGTPRSLTAPDEARGENNHRWPHALPNGRAVLFTAMTSSNREEERRVAAVATEGGPARTLVEGGSDPRFVAGHLMYARGGALFAAPFDADRLLVTGAATRVLEDVRMAAKGGSGLAQYDVSLRGGLVYVPGYPRLPERSLLWLDRQGRTEPVTGERRAFADPALSPDGHRLAVTIQGPTDEVWIRDLPRETWSRLTSGGDNAGPVWSADGARVVFSSNRGGQWNLFWMPADGGASAEALTSSPNWIHPTSVAPDGATVAFEELTASTGWDVGLLAWGDAASTRPLLAAPPHETLARFSPDGRWLAYVSTESGREEVYVRRHPGPSGRWPVSAAGGTAPVWSRDGRELFYRSGDSIQSVAVGDAREFKAGPSRTVVTASFEPALRSPNYDVGPDARFVVVRSDAATPAPLQLVVIPDWSEELRHRTH